MLICGDAGIGRQASLRCLCQYWRVGSSPISRTSVKDIRFSSVLYFYIRQISKALSAKKPHWNRTKSLISWKRNLFRSQTGKLEVLVSVLACGFKSHFPHQCKGHSIFECPLFLYPTNQQSIISKKATLESHEIFDFVEAELVPQSDRQA